jgi:hypothetical protein
VRNRIPEVKKEIKFIEHQRHERAKPVSVSLETVTVLMGINP